MTTETSPAIAYVGPSGADLGFLLAGVATYACDDADALVLLLRDLRDSARHTLIFIDDSVAAPVLDEVERLNQQPIPALILISNPTQANHVAQEKMDRLIIKALGADILTT